MTHEVPEGWKTAKLNDALKLNRESVSVAQLVEAGQVLLHSIPAFDEWRKPERCDGGSIKSNKTAVPQDCVLFSKLNPRIPRVWRVKHNGETPSVCSTEFWPLTSRTSSIDLDFTTYFLASPLFLEDPQIKPASSTNSHQRVDRKAFENFTLCLPPLPEQKKIAEVLSSVDEAIAATKAVIDQTKQVKKGLLQTLLTKGIGHTTFKQTPLGEIPESWEVVKLEDLLADTQTPMRSGPFGSALKKDELVQMGIPFLGIDNVHVEKFVPSFKRFVSPEKFNELHRYAVFSQDIMITIMGTVGRCCVVPNNVGEMLSSKHIWTMTLDRKQYVPELMCWQLNYAPWVLKEFMRTAQGGIMAAISSKVLRSVLVPKPPIEEQEKIASQLNDFNASIDVNENKLAQLQTLKSGLMSDLLTGRKQVEV